MAGGYQAFARLVRNQVLMQQKEREIRNFVMVAEELWGCAKIGI
jgi:hypothetical protein